MSTALLFLSFLLKVQAITPAHNRHIICNTTTLRNSVQRSQLERARKELGVVSPLNDDGFAGFYTHSYGMASVDGAASEAAMEVGASFPSHIVYYGIAGNEDKHIKTLLHNFATIASFRYREYTAFLSIPDSGGRGEADSIFVPFKLFKSSVGRRYAFTFTRDPLSRFVSAYTEAERRVLQSSQAASAAPSSHAPDWFQSSAPPGSLARVKDFIHAMLSADGAAQGLFSNVSDAAAHLFAQVGAVAQVRAPGWQTVPRIQARQPSLPWASLAPPWHTMLIHAHLHTTQGAHGGEATGAALSYRALRRRVGRCVMQPWTGR